MDEEPKKKTTNEEDISQQFRRSQQWEVVRALLQRIDAASQAKQAFRQTYPDASESIVTAAVFHTYVDGVGAVIDWLVDLELFLHGSSQELDIGATYHVLYHLYNWYQLSLLLPGSTRGVLEHLQAIKDRVADGDMEAILATVEELESIFEGSRNYPDV